MKKSVTNINNTLVTEINNSQIKGQQSLPCGDKPFIYAANLNLYELIAWLQNEINALNRRERALCIISKTVDSLELEINSLVTHQPFSESVHLSQESNLLLDSNQCQMRLCSALNYLRSFGLSEVDFPGQGLSEEQRQSIRADWFPVPEEKLDTE
ncbi:hypothetical protein TCT1_30510 [Xenorhabdus sp. TCT-1]|uniref:Uncharacterized protein n=1 Tax=Xenorhabdus taiwanensis TaxID=3085177 RepID=A0ABN7C7L9_9GAMM|nr:hypothetical protein TCT1_30510 [Xenorhabdus sp. TCT-1]